MIRSTLIGIAAAFGLIIVLGAALGAFAVPQGLLNSTTFAERHNLLVEQHYIQVAQVVAWFVSALLGGFIAARGQRERWLFRSLWVGVALLVLWGIPTAVLAGARLSMVHVLCVVALVPGSLCGGYLVRPGKAA